MQSTERKGYEPLSKDALDTFVVMNMGISCEYHVNILDLSMKHGDVRCGPVDG